MTMSQGPYIGAVDQGTTSSRFIVFDRSGGIVSLAQTEHAQIYPRPGWVEHDAMEIWTNTERVIAEALAKADLKAADLAAVGVTNQRETTVVWDRRTGLPVHNALVWQDTRVDRIARQYAAEGGADRFRAKTGLPLASYFSGLKLKWILDHVPGLRARAAAGEIAFGTVDSWLLWKLTDGQVGAGEMLLIDWGAQWKLYKSDLTRVLVTGKISTKLRRVYEVVLSAQAQAILKAAGFGPPPSQ